MTGFDALLSDLTVESVNGSSGQMPDAATTAVEARAIVDRADWALVRRSTYPKPMVTGWKVTREDPALAAHPELKGRIVTAGWDAGAA